MPESRGDEWDIRSVLEWTIGYLESHGDEHPRLSAEWLISAATGLSRVELYTCFDRPLSPDERAVLRGSVKRRAVGEPLQYVTGEIAFRHLVLKVRKGVLIPRPETEITVETGLAELAEIAGRVEQAEQTATPRALDLCTGSGCIALSIAQENPQVQVTAIDLSPEAIALARDNVSALHLDERITVLEGDLFEPLGSEERFGLIISNPPYIPTAELATLPGEVADFEPQLALDGGVDGLAVFRRILEGAPSRLSAGGVLVCELHEECLSEAACLSGQVFEDVEVLRDLTGRERVLVARKNSAEWL